MVLAIGFLSLYLIMSILRSIAATTNNLAKPEFAGMWNQFEKYVVPKDVVVDIIKGQKISKVKYKSMNGCSLQDCINYLVS